MISPTSMIEPPNKNLDNIDKKILMHMQRDGRISFADLSKKIGLSPSPCFRRLRSLETGGVILGYAALLDQKKVGLPVNVFVSVKLEKSRGEALARFSNAIAGWPEVLECYLMTGTRDYLLKVVVADIDAYETFLTEKLMQLEGVVSIESSIALSQAKHTNILPLD